MTYTMTEYSLLEPNRIRNLAMALQAGDVVSHDVLDTLGDDQLDELRQRIAKYGMRSETSDRGLEVRL